MNIDRIAREMVNIEPSADLETRIRARVRAAQPERANVWWVWRVAMPVAAAAAVTVAIAVREPASEVARPEPAPSAIQTARVSAPTAPATPSETPVRQRAIVKAANRSRAARSRTAELSAEELAWMERRPPALDPVTALQMDHLRVDSIQPEPLAITPLIMPPVTTEGSGIERRNNR